MYQGIRNGGNRPNDLHHTSIFLGGQSSHLVLLTERCWDILLPTDYEEFCSFWQIIEQRRFKCTTVATNAVHTAIVLAKKLRTRGGEKQQNIFRGGVHGDTK